jgi:hypothetical protein
VGNFCKISSIGSFGLNPSEKSIPNLIIAQGNWNNLFAGSTREWRRRLIKLSKCDSFNWKEYEVDGQPNEKDKTCHFIWFKEMFPALLKNIKEIFCLLFEFLRSDIPYGRNQ